MHDKRPLKGATDESFKHLLQLRFRALFLFLFIVFYLLLRGIKAKCVSVSV